MEQFNIAHIGAHNFEELRELLEKGIELGFYNIRPLLEKVDRATDTLKNGIIRIVLLGGFSDGKTTTIAGLMGRLDSTMKIDSDESSDELVVYRPDGLKKGFEVVDTPGLFGTKEREMSGEIVKFSDITKRYISEAHIVMYVCDAVNPLKESHVEILRHVLRDLKKLDSTIFVINKMDEAGIDLTDDNSYNEGVSIKVENIISRLRNKMALTPDEEKRLNIVCVSANPKGKGLDYWFNKSDDYIRRSRIKELRQCVTNVVEKCDRDKLQLSTLNSTIADTISLIDEQVLSAITPLQEFLQNANAQTDEMINDLELTKQDLLNARKELRNNVEDYINNLRQELDLATVETISGFMERHIGVENGEVTCYKINSKIEELISECGQRSQALLEERAVDINVKFAGQNAALDGIVKTGATFLKNVKISGEQVKMVRDLLFKNYKFKPWGAIKLGEKLTKAAGWAGVAIEVFTWGHKLYKNHKDKKKLNQIKTDLKGQFTAIEKSVLDFINDDQRFMSSFAPTFKTMTESLDSRRGEIEEMRLRLDKYYDYRKQLHNWLYRHAETVEFEEL